MLKRLTLIMTVLIAPSIASAEPTPNMRWLLKEPVTLMDLGLVLTELHLSEYYEIREANDSLSYNGKYMPRIEYDWDENRIKVSVEVYLDVKELEKTNLNAKSVCRIELRELRLGTSGLIGNFMHMDYLRNSQPKNVYRELGKITGYRVHIRRLEDRKDLAVCQRFQGEVSFIEG